MSFFRSTPTRSSVRTTAMKKLFLSLCLSFLLASFALDVRGEDGKVAVSAIEKPDVSKMGVGPGETDMKRLLEVTVSLPKGAKWVKQSVREMAIRAAWAAVEKEGALVWPGVQDAEVHMFQTVALLVVWSYFESAWKVDAKGDCTEVGSDGAIKNVPCKSVGVMQTNARFVGLEVAEKILKDPVMGFRAGLGIAHDAMKVCGGKSVRAAMGKYATGNFCGGHKVEVDYRFSFLPFKG